MMRRSRHDTRRTRPRAWAAWILVFASVFWLTPGSLERARAAPPQDHAAGNGAALDHVLAHLDAWDLDAARRGLPTITDPRELELARGVLAIYEADYEGAERSLAGVLAQASGSVSDADDSDPNDPVTARATYYLEIARGAQLALGDAITVVSEDGRFEAVFADPADELLAPYLFAAMAKAYDTLGADIGVTPTTPIRFEIYDEPGKLALVTPLTLDNIYTTGTVGICKYQRIMMITPRVMVYGYGWLDTAAHEYVHYLVTKRTRNNAPVWMQEGLAKLMEVRWRAPGQQELSVSMRRLLHDGLENDELVTLEQMHPSVAMLPSQEMAALAYAEAQTMLGLLEEERGPEGLAQLMDSVASGVDAKDAFADAWGASFDAFFEEWKSVMRKRTAGRGQAGAGSKISFRDPDDDSGTDPSLHGDVFSHLGGGRARQHARLGVLLTLRGHLEAAVIEYEKARTVDRSVIKDPELARRLGELYLKLDRAAEALPLLVLAGENDPENANIAAAEARARRLTHDPDGARLALDRALRQNPFIPGIHCDLAELSDDPVTKAAETELCPE